RPYNTHGRRAPFAVDENPVEEGVDDVGAYQREGDGLCHVHGLQATAHSEVQEQREEAESKGFHVRDGECGDLRFHAQRLEQRLEVPHGDHEEGRHDNTEINAVDQRPVTIFALTGTKGLSDESIEPDKHAAAEKSQDVEEVGTDADGTDGARAIRQVTNHDGIHDAHAHPADFCEHQWQSEPSGGAELVAKYREADHERASS